MKTNKIKRQSKAHKGRPRSRFAATPDLLELSTLLLFNPVDNIKVCLTKKGMKSADKICEDMPEKRTVVLHRNKKFFAKSMNNSDNLCTTADVSPEQNQLDREKLSSNRVDELLAAASGSQKCLCCVCPDKQGSEDKYTNTESTKPDTEKTRKPDEPRLVSIFTKAHIPNEQDNAENEASDSDEHEELVPAEERISPREYMNKWNEFNNNNNNNN